MTTKHTPGPWLVEYGHNQKSGIRYWQIHDDLHAICQNHFCCAAENEDVSEANASLIAAAPDLLDACERAEMWFSTHPDGKIMRDVMRAAISKAEGQ